MFDAPLLDDGTVLSIDQSRQSFAHWAIKKPRRFPGVPDATLRLSPTSLKVTAVALCAASGLSLCALAGYAFSVLVSVP